MVRQCVLLVECWWLAPTKTQVRHVEIPEDYLLEHDVEVVDPLIAAAEGFLEIKGADGAAVGALASSPGSPEAMHVHADRTDGIRHLPSPSTVAIRLRLDCPTRLDRPTRPRPTPPCAQFSWHRFAQPRAK